MTVAYCVPRLQSYTTLPHPSVVPLGTRTHSNGALHPRSRSLGGKLRNSSFLRSNTLNAYTQKHLDKRRSRLVGRQAQPLYLPAEILTEIITHCISLEPTQPLYTYPTRLFRNIGPLLLASRHLRNIALVYLFLELNIVCPKSWSGLLIIMKRERVFSHVRCGYSYLICRSYISNDSRHVVANFEVLCTNKISLSVFPKLKTLAMSMSQENLMTIVGHVAMLMHNFNPQSLTHVMPFHVPADANTLPHLSELTLTDLPCITPALLRMIAIAIPCLIVLFLSCSERLDLNHCATCLDESMNRCIACPIPEEYPNAEALTHALSCPLSSLPFLRHLHIGLLLCRAQVLYDHMAHSRSTIRIALDQSTSDASDFELYSRDIPTHATVSTRFADMNLIIARPPPIELTEPRLLDIPGHNVPVHPVECQRCQTCREAYDTRMDELRASMMFAQRLKTIESIGWSSFFGTLPHKTGVTAIPHRCKIGDWVSARTVWVKRVNGIIRVRERPWQVGVGQNALHE